MPCTNFIRCVRKPLDSGQPVHGGVGRCFLSQNHVSLLGSVLTVNNFPTFIFSRTLTSSTKFSVFSLVGGRSTMKVLKRLKSLSAMGKSITYSPRSIVSHSLRSMCRLRKFGACSRHLMPYFEHGAYGSSKSGSSACVKMKFSRPSPPFGSMRRYLWCATFR